MTVVVVDDFSFFAVLNLLNTNILLDHFGLEKVCNDWIKKYEL